MMTFVTYEQSKAFLSVPDVAYLLNVSYSTVYRLIYDGELPAIMIRHTYRIQTSDLKDYIDKQKLK